VEKVHLMKNIICGQTKGRQTNQTDRMTEGLQNTPYLNTYKVTMSLSSNRNGCLIVAAAMDMQMQSAINIMHHYHTCRLTLLTFSTNI